MTEIEVPGLSGHPVPATIVAAEDSGHIVVLSHGIFVDRQENGRFERFSELLRVNGISSIRPDLSGHGQSAVPSRSTLASGMATDLLDVITWAQSNYEKVSVVASSFSGALLVLIADQELQSTLHRSIFLNPVLDFVNVFVEAELPEMAEMFSPEAFDLASRQGFFPATAQFDVSRELLLELARVDVPGAYEEFTVPHLVFHGTSDELVSYRRASELIHKNPNAELVSVEGAVHAFTQSGHEGFVWESVLEYLRS